MKTFANFFVHENKGEWNNDKFFIVMRTKKAYFEFVCTKCAHTWSTKYGTFKFYIAFKKGPDGFLMEDEVFVRVQAFRQDCKNCNKFAPAGYL